MKDRPDFLVIGAQKAGTTTLFALLAKHPKIYIPLHKEVQFFSHDEFYSKGLEWYWNENFRVVDLDAVAGEISPHYMIDKIVPRRIKETLPDVKLIAILRHPLARAYSQYRMSVRRGGEHRDFREAFEHSIEKFRTKSYFVESHAYFQLSNYADILSEYLKFFPKERVLIVFQEDLHKKPRVVLRKIHEFLGVVPCMPKNINIRLHAGGDVKYKWLRDLLLKPKIFSYVAKCLFSFRIRQAIRFWLEQFNISKTNPESIPVDVLRDFDWVVREQMDFLKVELGIIAPWRAGIE